MNHIYKTIWNRAKNAFDVVAENVSARSKQTAGEKQNTASDTSGTASRVNSYFLAVLTPVAAMLFMQTSLANPVVVDGNKTQVYNANNGVQVIDIATANAGGISHNRFVNYNVDQKGQVLNNAMQTANQLSVMTDLAGKIRTNANLDQSAKVILNEVTGPNRSVLNGHIEVAGKQADVIIANAYGITCAGCGFINTDKATLTTGVPTFNADGTVRQFNISQGEILINQNGLNANNTNLLRLLSRNLVIDGQVNAQQLEAVIGANRYTEATGDIQTIEAIDAAKSYAIDSTQLGGIYANRIHLIATEQGVGVRMQGDVAASAADFSLSSAGKIELKNKISAKNNISVQSSSTQHQDLLLKGALSAENILLGDESKKNFNIDIDRGSVYAANRLDVSGHHLNANQANIQSKATADLNIAESVKLDSSHIDTADLNINALEMTADTSQLVASKNIKINTQTDLLMQQSDLQAKHAIALKVDQGNIRIDQGILKADQELSLSADNIHLNTQTSAANTNVLAKDQFTLDEKAIVISQQNTLLNTRDATINGKMHSDNATITIGKTLRSANTAEIISKNKTITQAENLDLNGQWYADSLALHATQSLKQAGEVSATQKLQLTADQIRLKGKTFADQVVVVEAKDNLTVEQDALLTSADTLNLVANTIQIDGYVAASNHLDATAQNQLTSGISSKIQAGNTQNLTAVNADLNLNGLSYAKQLTLQAKNDIKLGDKSSVVATEQLKLSAEGLDNAGKISAQGTLTADVKQINNQAELISNRFNLANLKILKNSGRIISNQDLAIRTDQFENTGQAIIASNANLEIKVSHPVLSNQGNLTAFKNLSLETLDPKGVVQNHGSITAGNLIRIDTDRFINGGTGSNNTKLTAGNITVEANQIENKAEIAANRVYLKADKTADGQINNTGDIFATDQIDLTAEKQIVNNGKIYTVNDQQAAAIHLKTRELQNNAKAVLSTQQLNLNVDEIVNRGKLITDHAAINSYKNTQSNLSNEGQANNGLGIYIFKTLQAKNLNHLKNDGDIYVNISKAAQASLINVAQLENTKNAYLYLGADTVLNQKNGATLNQGEIYLEGKNELNLEKLDNTTGVLTIEHGQLSVSGDFNNTGVINGYKQALLKFKNLSNTNTINVNDSILNAQNIVNHETFNSEGSSDIVVENKFENNALIYAKGVLSLDAQDFVNRAKAGIISLGDLNINTTLEKQNTLHNYGDIYADNNLNIGSKSRQNTDVFNQMNSNKGELSGGVLNTGQSMNIYANNFTNTYQVLAQKGNINIAVSGSFVNERSYYGERIELTEHWKNPELYLSSNNGWGEEVYYDKASNTAIFSPQEAIRGSGNGLNANLITEVWRKSIEAKAGNETNYDTIKTYLATNKGEAVIGANDGNINITFKKNSTNRGGSVYALGDSKLESAKGQVKIVGEGEFNNQSIDMYKDKLYELKYRYLSDDSSNAAALMSKDATKPKDFPLKGGQGNALDNDSIKKVNNYIDDYVKGVDGIYYIASYDNSDTYIKVKDLSGDVFNISYNDKWVLDGLRQQVKDDGYTALVEKTSFYVDGKGYANEETEDYFKYGGSKALLQRDEVSAKANISGSLVQIKSEKIVNESIKHPPLEAKDPNQLCKDIALSCSIDPNQQVKDHHEKQLTDRKATDVTQQNKDNSDYNQTTQIEPVISDYQRPKVDLSLPNSNYGQYVASKNPNSNYLIESNPLYGKNANVLSTDYLQRQLGLNPDALSKRLGDSSYEMNLVQQQLRAALGTAVLSANQSMLDQMKMLYDQAAVESKTLGLEYGKALTENQLSNLKQDIVWMVESEVAGQKVLVPQVYLSKATVDQIQTAGAVIDGKVQTHLQVNQLDNKNASIAGGNVIVEATRDINNIGAKIKGENVVLASKEGSINNITEVRGSGSSIDYSTSIGQVSSIESDGILILNAGQDINNKGAKLKAGDGAIIQAGNNINIESIQHKTASTNSIKNGQTTTRTVTNMGSTVDIAGDVILNSGNNTTISGSDVNVSGLLYAKTGGDFKLESVQDTTETETTTSRSGLGVGGGVWGKETVKTLDFEGKNKASNLNVGQLAIEADQKVIIAGSNINMTDADTTNMIYGKAGVDILDGKDETRHEKTTTTTTYLKATKGKSSNDEPIYGSTVDGFVQKQELTTTQQAYVDANQDESGVQTQAEATTQRSKLRANAEVRAEASAQGESSLKISETTKTVDKSATSSSIASNINSAGDLKIISEGTVNVRGSNLDVNGALAIKAQDLIVEAGQNTATASRDMTRTSVGIFAEGDAKAQANAQVGANVAANGVDVGGSAGASAEASGTVTFGVKHEQENQSMQSTTHTQSSLKSGEDMTLIVDNTATFKGANVEAGIRNEDGSLNQRGDIYIKAKDINNLAVNDHYVEEKSSASKLVGIYLGASANAEANAQAGAAADITNPNPLKAGASASAGVELEVGVGLRTKIENSDEKYESNTYTGNSFNTTGNLTRIAENSILDQATQVDAGGIYQRAQQITDEAVTNSQTYTNHSQSHEAKLGLYATAGASASASAEVNLGATASASKESKSSGAAEKDSGTGKSSPKIAGGISAQYTGEVASGFSKDTQQIGSQFKSSGDIHSISSGETRLSGTQFKAGNDINIEASKLNYAALENTHKSDSSSHGIDVAVKVGLDLSGAPDVEASAGYANKSSHQAAKNTVIGALQADGKINIKADQVQLVGTKIESGSDTHIQTNEIQMKAAESSSSSNSTSFDLGLSYGHSQKSNKAVEQTKRTTVHQPQGEEESRHEGGLVAGFDINKQSEKTYQGAEIRTGGSFVIDAKEGATVRGNLENVTLAVGAQTEIGTQVTQTYQADQKSSFELGGKGTIDSDDFKQVRSIKETYKDTTQPTDGTINVTLEKTQLNNINGTEHLNKTISSVKITDVVSKGLSRLKGNAAALPAQPSIPTINPQAIPNPVSSTPP